MPRSTIGGDDPFYKRPFREREKKAKELLREAKEELEKRNFKKSNELRKRAKNLLRKESKKSQHH